MHKFWKHKKKHKVIPREQNWNDLRRIIFFVFRNYLKKKKKIKSVGFASNEIIRKPKVFLLTYQFKGKIRNITYNKKCFSYTVIGLCYHGEVWVFGTS